MLMGSTTIMLLLQCDTGVQTAPQCSWVLKVEERSGSAMVLTSQASLRPPAAAAVRGWHVQRCPVRVTAQGGGTKWVLDVAVKPGLPTPVRCGGCGT